MTSLPTGTVAFFMSDIEGSTRLISAVGDAFPRMLDEHHSLMDAAIDAEGGTVVSTEGDSFFAVFSSARQAVAAAIHAQGAMAGHRWPMEAQVRVRIGIHAAEAVLGGKDYTGLELPYGAHHGRRLGRPDRDLRGGSRACGSGPT